MFTKTVFIASANKHRLNITTAVKSNSGSTFFIIILTNSRTSGSFRENNYITALISEFFTFNKYIIKISCVGNISLLNNATKWSMSKTATNNTCRIRYKRHNVNKIKK